MLNLSLDTLNTLVTIVDEGGFARAGDRLGRSQPAVSLQIKKLEQLLGKPLFNKQGQRQILNADGQWLVDQARVMLSMNQHIVNHFTEQELSGRIRLGIPSEFASFLLPAVLGEFARRYPDVTLEVSSNLSRTLLQDVASSKLDVVLAITEQDESTDAQDAVFTLVDRLVWVGDAKRIKRAALLKNIPLVLAAEGCVYRARVIDKLKQQTNPWRIAYTNSDLGGLSAAMHQGLGISALASCSVPSDLQTLRFAELPKLGKVNVSLFRYEQTGVSTQTLAAMDTLLEFLAERLKRYQNQSKV